MLQKHDECHSLSHMLFEWQKRTAHKSMCLYWHNGSHTQDMSGNMVSNIQFKWMRNLPSQVYGALWKAFVCRGMMRKIPGPFVLKTQLWLYFSNMRKTVKKAWFYCLQPSTILNIVYLGWKVIDTFAYLWLFFAYKTLFA